MIRVRKSTETPPSLLRPDCKKYDGEDVQELLYSDHDGKCYLCEQKTSKDYEIEHYKSEAKFPDLKFQWDNLLLACGYCNSRKSKGYELLLNPLMENIEDIIEQRILFEKNTSIVEFKSNAESDSIENTISLLNKLINGESGIRKHRCQILFNDITREINFFSKQLSLYLSSPDDATKQAIIDCLQPTKEFLGLKYWIIKDNEQLYNEFQQYLVWNKCDK